MEEERKGRKSEGARKILEGERDKKRGKELEVGEFKVRETFSHRDPILQIADCAYTDSAIPLSLSSFYATCRFDPPTLTFPIRFNFFAYLY